MARSVEGVAEEISQYCAVHPDARDSLDGISWWLAPRQGDVTREQLHAAVELLVSRGVLAAHRLHDGSMVFGCSESSGASGST